MAVGPESARAHPGPVAYRKNGYLAVTDANVVTGRIQPDVFPSIFGPKARADEFICCATTLCLARAVSTLRLHQRTATHSTSPVSLLLVVFVVDTASLMHALVCGLVHQEDQPLDVEGSRAALQDITDEVNALALEAATARGDPSLAAVKSVDEVCSGGCHSALDGAAPTAWEPAGGWVSVFVCVHPGQLCLCRSLWGSWRWQTKPCVAPFVS